MSNIFQILNTSRDSLLGHQTAINVTASNIANVNTPGYSRQRAVFSSSGSLESGTVGVKITDIERIYDRLLEVQVTDQEQNVGYSEARSDALNRAESVFNESQGGGINELLNEFWSAWEDLSANPDGQVERLAMSSVSQSLASVFRQYSDELSDVRKDANTRIAGDVNRINEYTSGISDLNDRILRAEGGGGISNDLKDKRAELLRELSNIVDIHYLEDEDGALNIFLSNGKPLVEGNLSWGLDVKKNVDNSAFYDVVFKDDPDEEVINSVITSGELGGLLEVRDVTVVDYMNRLDSLAAKIIENVNIQHAEGYDINGNTGEFFFAPATKAEDMYVSAAIISDTNRIAASATVNNDGDNAIAMAAIKDKPIIINDITSTFNSHYASLVGRVGSDAAVAERRVDHQTVISDQLTNRREGISGVSIDEEMMNLMKYQLGYNAAGRLCNVANEMMDTLLSIV